MFRFSHISSKIILNSFPSNLSNRSFRVCCFPLQANNPPRDVRNASWYLLKPRRNRFYTAKSFVLRDTQSVKKANSLLSNGTSSSTHNRSIATWIKTVLSYSAQLIIFISLLLHKPNTALWNSLSINDLGTETHRPCHCACVQGSHHNLTLSSIVGIAGISLSQL